MLHQKLQLPKLKHLASCTICPTAPHSFSSLLNSSSVRLRDDEFNSWSEECLLPKKKVDLETYPLLRIKITYWLPSNFTQNKEFTLVVWCQKTNNRNAEIKGKRNLLRYGNVLGKVIKNKEMCTCVGLLCHQWWPQAETCWSIDKVDLQTFSILVPESPTLLRCNLDSCCGGICGG